MRESEAQLVQNAGLGAFLLWKFGMGFQQEVSRPSNIALAFLVLPLVLHRPTLDTVTSTQRRSGLLLFAAKLGEEKENLLTIHDRALALRELTVRSLATGAATKLLTIDYHDATARSNALKEPRIPERLKPLSAGAEKIGAWCARLSPSQTAAALKVYF